MSFVLSQYRTLLLVIGRCEVVYDRVERLLYYRLAATGLVVTKRYSSSSNSRGCGMAVF